MRNKNDGKGRLGGRAAGTSNKVTVEMKFWVQGLIDQNRKLLKADLKKLKPEQRWQVVERLMNYCIPKQQSMQAGINFEKMDEATLDLIIEKILNTNKP